MARKISCLSILISILCLNFTPVSAQQSPSINGSVPSGFVFPNRFNPTYQQKLNQVQRNQINAALVEEILDERLEHATTESFSLPEATANPGLLPTKTPGDTTSLPTVTADIQTFKYYTYPFTQTAINQFCLKVPGNDYSAPLYLGDRYLVSLNDFKSLNISTVSLADGSLTPLHLPEFPNDYPFGGGLIPQLLSY